MLHVRQLWARPLTHSSWFKQLTRSYLQHASRNLSVSYAGGPPHQHPPHLPSVSQPAALCVSSYRPKALSQHFLSTSARRKSATQQRRVAGDAASSPLPDSSAEQCRVAIFGRPNVGKSTLFNRLVGRHVAITDSTPGVTRDPLHHTATLASLRFTLIDTAGLEPVQSFLAQPPSPSQLVNKQHPSVSLQHTIQQLTRRAVRDCHIALFLIDARQPLTNDDVQYARMVREEHHTLVTAADGTQHKQMLPVVLIANKSEEGVERDRLEGLQGVYQLGLGEPIEMSAEHGEGLAMLHNVLDRHMQALAAQRKAATEAERSADKSEDVDASKPIIEMAIVGRPNTGKSTLLNALLRDERALTGPQPGITRDPIRSLLPTTSHPLYRFHVVDTAGIRGGVIRREGETRVDAEAMRLSMRAIDRANIVLLVLDVSGGTQLGGGKGQAGRRWKGKEEEEEAVLLSRVSGMVSQQDLTIAKRVIDEGRGLVVALNKADLLGKDEKHDVLRGLRLLLDRSLPQVKDVPLIPLSATTTLHLSTLLPSIVWLYERWNKSVPTNRLTDWLLQLQSYRPHPSYKGRRIRFKFMRQVAVRPPTFSVWVGGGSKAGRDGGEVEGVSQEWVRMMRGMLCHEFGLDGVNVRVKLKRGEVKDREERRQDARMRDQKEEEQRVRQSAIEVQGEEGEQDAGDMEGQREGEGEMEMERDEDEWAGDIDIHDYNLRAVDEGRDDEEKGEVAYEEVEEADDDTDEAAEGSLQVSTPSRPRFVPFNQDPERIAAVAAATAFPSTTLHPSAALSTPSSTLPPVLGFMSPSPLATATSTSLAYPTHARRPSRSHLSFLPLPAPPRPSTSLAWSERRLVQQKKTERRSTAIREMKEQAQFVSVAAWRKWKDSEEERRQRYLRRERKIVAGRERKAAGKQREKEVRVVGVDEEEEDGGKKRNKRERRGGNSRHQRRSASRARG